MVSYKIPCCCLLISLSWTALSHELDSEIFLGISLGVPDKNMLDSLGLLKSGFNVVCYHDHNKSAVFRIENDTKHDYIKTKSVTLSKDKPEACKEWSGSIPGFGLAHPGLYQVEVDNYFVRMGYQRAAATKSGVVYEKAIMGEFECKKFDDEYEDVHFWQGRSGKMLRYEITDIVDGKVGSIAKALVYIGKGSIVESCPKQ